MLLTANKKRQAKLTKQEQKHLKQAKEILLLLEQFMGIKTIDEALSRIAEDGTVGDPPADAE